MVKVKNLHGTTDCKCCDSWIEHWIKHTGKQYGYIVCKCCGKLTRDPVGGHVVKTNSTDKRRYIVPLCKSCNASTNEEEFDVKLEDLVWVCACSEEN